MKKGYNFKSSDYLVFLIWGIWLFALLFLRRWHVFGPVSFRNFAGIMIVPVAIFMHGRIKATNTIKLYIIWNVFYILINMLKGFNVIFTNNYIAYNVVSFCILYSIPKLVKNYKTLYMLAIWFVVFYILNSFLSIFQFLNNGVAWAITTFISPISESELLEYSYYENEENLLFHSLCSGLNGFVVTNGYFIAGFLPIASILIWKKNKMSVITGSCILLLGVACAFCTQQRMCFLLVSLFIVYVLYFRSSIGIKVAISIIGLSFIMIYAESFLFDSSSYGRLLSTDANGRSQTLDHASMFFSDWNYFFTGNLAGGQLAGEMVKTLGHNCFLDSLRRGGFFSLVIFVILFFVVTLELKNVIYSSRKNGDNITLCFALAALLNILYSFTHSDNIISGSVFFWLSYSLMRASLKIKAINLQKLR